MQNSAAEMESSPATTILLTSDDDDIWSPSRSALYRDEELLNWEDSDDAVDDVPEQSRAVDDVPGYLSVVWVHDSSTQTDQQDDEAENLRAMSMSPVRPITPEAAISPIRVPTSGFDEDKENISEECTKCFCRRRRRDRRHHRRCHYCRHHVRDNHHRRRQSHDHRRNHHRRDRNHHHHHHHHRRSHQNLRI
ncbi:lateral signaling target protein 2 homolog [Leptopilina heterotoma]|uniref:lateral signaling target protein 2 homolog n=1 Tax=Leptopilina heterotoma TaxID=63436 RepID=UPI001CA940F1|nr:lateral signaling target protein 2 homolog [Leptopilina heterotoma]